MNFEDYKYERVDIDSFKKNVDFFIKELDSKDSNHACEIFNLYCEKLNNINTMLELAMIRFSINTNDEFYSKENDFYDENNPSIYEIKDRFIKSLLNSKYRKDLEEKFGKYIFKKYELQFKVFDPIIKDDLIEENKLVTKYSCLMASCQIEFEEKKCNLSQIQTYYQSDNRELREKAWKTFWSFFEENEEKFNTIYDDLVKVRTRIAKKLGYKNFVQLAYDRLERTDYNSKDVKKYRDEIASYVVPLTNKIYEEQKKRLDLDKLYYYDINYSFNDGNPKPIGDCDYLVSKALEMYSKISPETKEFFEFMVKHNLLDLVAKPGKQGGGYCTYITNYKSPFIFSNFNGTSADVDVLTHEAGHAFQVFSSRNIKIPELLWPTYEACEIHSMSMEFFAEPYIDLFFGKDANKYLYTHLADALEFLPYGASIDEFQEWVYENPDCSKEDRLNKYRDLERKYLPIKDYKDNEILSRGAYWLRQAHIFESPFYYIDYTLAQVCAFQFLIKDLENHSKAWEDYYRLCKTGGLKPFLDLINVANLHNPFIDGTIKKICDKCENILKNREL